MINFKLSILSIFVLTTLTACGGGGGSESTGGSNGGDSGSGSRKAECGISAGSFFDTTPVDNLCAANKGVASSVTKTGNTFSWSCTVDQYNKTDCNAKENKKPVLTVSSEKTVNADGSFVIPFSVVDAEKDTYSVSVVDFKVSNNKRAEYSVDLQNNQIIVKPNMEDLKDSDFVVTFSIVIKQISNTQLVNPEVKSSTITLDIKQQAECGTSNGGFFSATPTENLCSQGIPSVVSLSNDKTKYNWSCTVANVNTKSCTASFNSKPTLTIDTTKNSVNENEVLEISYTATDIENDELDVVLESNIPENKKATVVLDKDNKKIIVSPMGTSSNYPINLKLTATQKGRGDHVVSLTHGVLVNNSTNSNPEISVLTTEARLEKQTVNADGKIVKGNDLTDKMTYENGKFVIMSNEEEEDIPNTQYANAVIPLSLIDADDDLLTVNVTSLSGNSSSANYIKDYNMNGTIIPHAIVISGLNRQYTSSAESSFVIKVKDNSEGNAQEVSETVSYVVRKVEALPVLKITPLSKTEFNNYEDIKVSISYSDKNNDLDKVTANVEIAPNVGTDKVTYNSVVSGNEFVISNMNLDFVTNPSERIFKILLSVKDKTNREDQEIIEVKVKEDKDKSIETLNKKVDDSITAFNTIKNLDNESKLLNFYLDYLDLSTQLAGDKKTYQDNLKQLKTESVNDVQQLITSINTERAKPLNTELEKQTRITYLIAKEKELYEKVYSFGSNQVDYINDVSRMATGNKLPIIDNQLLIEKTKNSGYSRYVGKNKYGYYADPETQNIWIFNSEYSVFDIVNNISSVCR